MSQSRTPWSDGGGGPPGDASPRGRDMLSGPADDTRPTNPWPRLLAFFAVMLGAVFLAGLCTSTFISTPDREIRVRLTEFQPGTPKFLPVLSFGHDQHQRTFGAFLAVPPDAVPPDEGDAMALFSREPASGCNLLWEPLTPQDEAGAVLGIYVDPCSDARYAFDGRAIHEGATHDLHRFAVRREVTGYVVNFEELILGACRGAGVERCSIEGAPVTIKVPTGELPEDFGAR